MSKFNFLAGGYYGKLGETVGQRWKNKRIVRSYSKPSDPRTEKQQANREQFSIATKATQLAMQMNGGDKLWYSASNTEFARRISDARNALKLSQNLVQIMPLIPYGTLADIEMSTQINVDEQTLTYFSLADEDLSGRKLSVITQAVKIGTEKIENFVLSGTFAGTPGNWSVTVQIPTGYAVNKDCWTAAVSPATKTENEAVIYLAPQTVLPAVETVYLTIASAAAKTAADGARSIVLSFPQEIESGLPDVDVVANGLYNSQGKNIALSVETKAKFAGKTLTFDIPVSDDVFGNPARFGTKNTFDISYIEVDGADKRYILEAQTVDNIADDKAETRFPLAFTVTNQSYSDTKWIGKTDLTPIFTVTKQGGADAEYYNKWDKDPDSFGGNTAEYDANTKTIEIEMDSDQRHFTSNRDITLSTGIEMEFDGLAYGIPANTKIEQTNVVTEHYKVPITIEDVNLVRNNANSYTITLNVSEDNSNGNEISVNFSIEGILQAKVEEQLYTKKLSFTNGKITDTFAPDVDSLNQPAQYTQECFIGAANSTGTVGMTDWEINADYFEAPNLTTVEQTWIPGEMQVKNNQFRIAVPVANPSFYELSDCDKCVYFKYTRAFSEGVVETVAVQNDNELWVRVGDSGVNSNAYAGGTFWVQLKADYKFTYKGVPYVMQKKKFTASGLPTRIADDIVAGQNAFGRGYEDKIEMDVELRSIFSSGTDNITMNIFQPAAATGDLTAYSVSQGKPFNWNMAVGTWDVTLDNYDYDEDLAYLFISVSSQEIGSQVLDDEELAITWRNSNAEFEFTFDQEGEARELTIVNSRWD